MYKPGAADIHLIALDQGAKAGRLASDVNVQAILRAPHSGVYGQRKILWRSSYCAKACRIRSLFPGGIKIVWGFGGQKTGIFYAGHIGQRCQNSSLLIGRLAKNRIVDPAEVARRDPQVIFASWCGKKMKKSTVQSRPGWDTVSGVRDDRIFEIKSTYILQPGPASLTDGVRQIHDKLRALFTTEDTKDTKGEH